MYYLFPVQITPRMDVDHHSDLTHLHKVDHFLSNLLKVFHRDFFTIQRFYFPKIFFEMINIHILDLILWNFNMNCTRWTIIWRVSSFHNIFITFIIRNRFASIREKYQVDRTHQNLEYLQDIPYHRRVLVPHHYCKPYWNYHLFCNRQRFIYWYREANLIPE